MRGMLESWCCQLCSVRARTLVCYQPLCSCQCRALWGLLWEKELQLSQAQCKLLAQRCSITPGWAALASGVHLGTGWHCLCWTRRKLLAAPHRTTPLAPCCQHLAMQTPYTGAEHEALLESKRNGTTEQTIAISNYCCSFLQITQKVVSLFGNVLPSHPTPKKLLCKVLYCVTRGISEGILVLKLSCVGVFVLF